MKYYASLSVYRRCGRQNDHEPRTDCQFRRVACIAFTLFLYLWKESGRFSLLRKGRKQCFYPCPGPSSRQIPVPQIPSGRCQNRNSRQQGGCQAEDLLQKPGGGASAGTGGWNGCPFTGLIWRETMNKGPCIRSISQDFISNATYITQRVRQNFT